MTFRWPLSVSTFTLRDRLRIASRIVRSDRYTMGPYVEEFERKMSEFSGMHALAVSSGSAANHLVFELWKIKNPGENAVVIVPAVTWPSAITPAIMAGFDVKFCDVNREDFSFDYEALEKMVKKYRKRRIIIWPTALIGYVPDVGRLNKIGGGGKVELFMDCCENTVSKMVKETWCETDLSEQNPKPDRIHTVEASILASCDITTTSCYFAHQLQAIEFGFVFFSDKTDLELGRMFRNHGMTRSLAADSPARIVAEQKAWEVDPSFLFAVRGTNFRPSDLNAMFGLADFERIHEAEAHRQKLYNRFRERMERTGYYLPPRQANQSMFCLPIFLHSPKTDGIKKALNAAGVETRPIVGGNLLRQPAFAGYGKATDFPNAEWINRAGFYVGLHKGVTLRMIDWLCDFLKVQI